MGHSIFGDFPHGGASGGLPNESFGLVGSPALLRHSSAHPRQTGTVHYTLHLTRGHNPPLSD